MLTLKFVRTSATSNASINFDADNYETVEEVLDAVNAQYNTEITAEDV